MTLVANSDAAAGAQFQSAIQASGLNVSRLGQIAQLQLGVAAMLVGGVPETVTSVTITSVSANTALVTGSGFSLTGSDATTMVSYAGTWNTSGTPTALKVAITDTSSNANSLLLSLASGSAGSTTRFSVSKNGTTTIATGNSVATLVITAGQIGGSNANTGIGYTQAWNTSGAPTAFSLAITNTASDAASLLMNLLAGAAAATVAFQVRATGKVGIGKAATATSPLCISGLPTSASGLATGDVWSNSGVLTIV
jgi:hypothetical protein